MVFLVGLAPDRWTRRRLARGDFDRRYDRRLLSVRHEVSGRDRDPHHQHLFGQDAHDFSLNSFTHAYPDVTNGRFEAAPESKVKNAKQIVLYALGFLCLKPGLKQCV